MDIAIRVQILDGTVCISFRANNHGKGMNPSLLPSQTLGKIVQQTRQSNLGRATSPEEGKNRILKLSPFGSLTLC